MTYMQSVSTPSPPTLCPLMPLLVVAGLTGERPSEAGFREVFLLALGSAHARAHHHLGGPTSGAPRARGMPAIDYCLLNFWHCLPGLFLVYVL